jgi:hypothetical protein
MKRRLSLILLICAVAVAVAVAQQASPVPSSPVHVATALNHLTVLEFHEAVTMAAAGSSDFQIERQEDKVFVKPTKSGAATDLFVWTASGRFFAYELETTPEVKDMSFSVNNPLAQPTSAPASTPSPHVEEFADLMLTRAFLGTVEIIPAKPQAEKKGHVYVWVQQVFRTKTTVYLQYTIENRSKRSYHVSEPSAFEVQPGRSTISLPAFSHKQLDARQLANLHGLNNVALPVAHAESAADDVNPGESTQGVVAIRQDLKSPTVVQLVFEGQVTATFVL